MSTTPSTARPKRSRTTRTATHGNAERTATAAPVVTADYRRALIAESAYLRAERRGFRGGDPVADWLESEREVDLLLSQPAD